MSILVLGSSSGLLTSALWDIAIQAFIDVVRKCSSTPSKEILLLESGSTGIQVLESLKKKRKLDEEKAMKKQKEKENRQEQRREREEKKKKRREKKEKEKIETEKKRAEAEQEREKKRNKKMKEEEEKKKKKEETRAMKSGEARKKKILKKRYKCRVEKCLKEWPSGSRHDDNWLWCDKCDVIGICFIHVHDEEQLFALQNHEENCKK